MYPTALTPQTRGEVPLYPRFSPPPVESEVAYPARRMPTLLDALPVEIRRAFSLADLSPGERAESSLVERIQVNAAATRLFIAPLGMWIDLEVER